MGRLNVTIVGAQGLRAADVGGSSDPYVKMKWGGQEFKTPKVKKTLNPTWNFQVLLDFNERPPNPYPPIRMEVYDWDRFSSDDFLGAAMVPIPALQTNGPPVDRSYPLEGGKGQLRVILQLLSGGAQPGGGAPQRPYQQQQVAPRPVYSSSHGNTPAYPQHHHGGPPIPSHGTFPGGHPPPPLPNHANSRPTSHGGSGAPPPQYSSGDPSAPPPYSAEGGVGQTNRRTSVQEILDVIPHIKRADVEDALRKCGGDKNAAMDLLMQQKNSSESRKTIEANPRFMKDIKEIFPHCSYEEIAKALVTAENDKEKAIDILITQQINNAASQAQHQPPPPTAPPAQQGESWFSMQPQQTTPQQAQPFSPVGVQPAQTGGAPPSQSGRRKALLIGINYLGSRAQLRGCINDVRNLRKVLTQIYRFPDTPQTMVVLTDDSPDPRFQPTKHNILTACRWLTLDARPGDALFFHFSGHGSQRPDPSGREDDGMDETILPVDFQRTGHIVDDELHALLVRPLPSGCRMTSVMDCCHSGTGLDLPFRWDMSRNTWIEEDNPDHSLGDVQLFSGCEDSQTSADASGHGGAFCPAGAAGAMTSAFIAALTQNPFGHTYPSLLNALHTNLKYRGFRQRPMLTTSQRFHFQRPFELTAAVPNSNPQVGRFTRKKKKPKKKFLGLGQGSDIGGIVMGGAMGMLALNALGNLGSFLD